MCFKKSFFVVGNLMSQVFYMYMYKLFMYTVLDLVSQIRDVVLVRFWETPGGWDFGMGRECGGDGNGEISLRATWDQGGRDPITTRRVPSK